MHSATLDIELTASKMKSPWKDGRLAANGRPVQENFSAWFGASKVVDARGLPLRVFHGTTSLFDAFEGMHSNKNTKTGVPESTFVFSSCPQAAASYAGQKTPSVSTLLPNETLYDEWLSLIRKHGLGGLSRQFYEKHAVENPVQYKEGGHVLPVYLQAKKLLKVNAKKSNWREIWFKDEDWQSNDLMLHARQKGYDGLVIRNVRDRQEGNGSAADTYAVFSPIQIKSTLNSGLFLRDSPSMTDFADSIALTRALRAREVSSKAIRKTLAGKRMTTSVQ